ncbi:MAG: hypothetical protein JOZ42_01490 [Acetobacteraceae bacterium]|nr:hypothetical protein [Acetobacteraceae bacterium]
MVPGAFVSHRRWPLLGGFPLLAAALLLPSLAPAQPAQAPPSRNANIWNGEAHEPNPSGVESRERRAGIAPDSQQQQQLNNEVEKLDRKLERRAQ